MQQKTKNTLTIGVVNEDGTRSELNVENQGADIRDITALNPQHSADVADPSLQYHWAPVEVKMKAVDGLWLLKFSLRIKTGLVQQKYVGYIEVNHDRFQRDIQQLEKEAAQIEASNMLGKDAPAYQEKLRNLENLRDVYAELQEKLEKQFFYADVVSAKFDSGQAIVEAYIPQELAMYMFPRMTDLEHTILTITE